MHTLLDLQLPPVAGRLRIPVVSTDYKQQAEQLSQSALEEFMGEHCHEVPGERILFSEFFDAFQKWLSPQQRREWSKIKTSRNMPPQFFDRRGRGQQEIHRVTSPRKNQARCRRTLGHLVSVEGKLCLDDK